MVKFAARNNSNSTGFCIAAHGKVALLCNVELEFGISEIFLGGLNRGFLPGFRLSGNVRGVVDIVSHRLGISEPSVAGFLKQASHYQDVRLQQKTVLQRIPWVRLVKQILGGLVEGIWSPKCVFVSRWTVFAPVIGLFPELINAFLVMVVFVILVQHQG